MKYAFIKSNRTQHSVLAMCKILKVSSSGYYDWLNRPISPREKANNALLEQIKVAYIATRKAGYRTIHAKLIQSGINCDDKKVYRLMNKAGFKSKNKRRFKATTNSKHSYPVFPNLLDRNFMAKKPNMTWVSDISYIWTNEGWLYLAIIIDLYSRAVVGWAMDSRMTTELIESALQMAIWNRKPPRDNSLIFHSDRGSQYASNKFQKILKEHKIICSMSRKGDCWDNAVAESFFGTIKTELVYHYSYRTRREAKNSIFEYIEVFYNRERLHSTLGYQSPMQFEMAA